MKTMKKLRGLRYFKLLMVFVMMCLIGTAFFGSMLSKAETTEKKLSETAVNLNVSVNINYVPIDQVKEVKYGDELTGKLEWSFDDDTPITTNDVFVYNLPNCINFAVKDGIIPDENNNEVGIYSIEADKIVVQYTNEDFVSENNRKSELSFSGTLNGEGTSDTEQKDIEVAFDGLGTYKITVLPLDKEAKIEVSKGFVTYNASEHIYTCNISVTSTGSNSNVSIKDKMYPGMSLYGDSPKIFVDSKCENEYIKSYTGFDENEGATELNAVIASMSDGEVIYIRYLVKVAPELYDWAKVNSYFGNVQDFEEYYSDGYEGRVPNRVDVHSDQCTEDKTAWADIRTLRYTFQKWNNEKENKRTEGKLSWQFVINSVNSNDVTSGWIIDTLPSNSSFVMDEDEIEIAINGGQSLGAAYNYISVEEMVGPNGEPQVKINFEDALLEELKLNEISIKYFTKVNKQDDDEAWYSNYAELFFNELTQGVRHNEMKFNKPDELTKIGKYNATTAPNAQYRIEVNPAGLDINPDGDKIILKDTMGSALDLDITSIRVNGVEVSGENMTYDPNARTFTLELSDNKAYVITYNAVVNLSAGEKLDASNASNTCELVGLTVKGGDKPTVIDAIVYESSASSSSNKDSVSIKVVKHDSKSTTDVLGGVTFRLESVTLSDNKVISSKLEKPSLTTDKNGIIEIEELKRNVVYCLTELETIEGYELASEPIYFVFEKNPQNAFPSVIEIGNDEFKVNIIDKSKAKETFYVANKKKETSSDSTTTEKPNADGSDSSVITTETTPSNSTVTTEATETTETTSSSDNKTTSETNKTTETKTESKNTSNTDKTAKTGDGSPIIPMVFVLCGSLLALIGLYSKKKKMF